MKVSSSVFPNKKSHLFLLSNILNPMHALMPLTSIYPSHLPSHLIISPFSKWRSCIEGFVFLSWRSISLNLVVDIASLITLSSMWAHAFIVLPWGPWSWILWMKCLVFFLSFLSLLSVSRLNRSRTIALLTLVVTFKTVVTLSFCLSPSLVLLWVVKLALNLMALPRFPGCAAR